MESASNIRREGLPRPGARQNKPFARLYPFATRRIVPKLGTWQTASCMRLFNRATLRDFWRRHADAQQPLRAWFAEVERAAWTGPAEVRSRHRSADFIGSDRIVFNIGGNKYRLVVTARYAKPSSKPPLAGMVFIRFLGTHAEYDRIDAARI
ncbi:MAG: type II toxin-antitoxin system HigB family toxin [Polyangiaceae bacterium]